MNYGLVWFKRDLRWRDHAALAHASSNKPVRCIYIIEPDLLLQPDYALQHFEFIRESLLELDSHLRARGGCIEIHTGKATDVFTKLWHESPFQGFIPTKKQVMDLPMRATFRWHLGAKQIMLRGENLRNLALCEVLKTAIYGRGRAEGQKS